MAVTLICTKVIHYQMKWIIGLRKYLFLTFFSVAQLRIHRSRSSSILSNHHFYQLHKSFPGPGPSSPWTSARASGQQHVGGGHVCLHGHHEHHTEQCNKCSIPWPAGSRPWSGNYLVWNKSVSCFNSDLLLPIHWSGHPVWCSCYCSDHCHGHSQVGYQTLVAP